MAPSPKPLPRRSAAAVDLRPSAARRGYDAAWRRLRAIVLSDEPLCRSCSLAGLVTEATQVDHIKPISEGGGRLDRSNLQPLCDLCHGAKTAADKIRRSKQ